MILKSKIICFLSYFFIIVFFNGCSSRSNAFSDLDKYHQSEANIIRDLFNRGKIEEAKSRLKKLSEGKPNNDPDICSLESQEVLYDVLGNPNEFFSDLIKKKDAMSLDAFVKSLPNDYEVKKSFEELKKGSEILDRNESYSGALASNAGKYYLLYATALIRERAYNGTDANSRVYDEVKNNVMTEDQEQEIYKALYKAQKHGANSNDPLLKASTMKMMTAITKPDAKGLFPSDLEDVTGEGAGVIKDFVRKNHGQIKS